jgi:uncharacterized protein (TIGR03435 family)
MLKMRHVVAPVLLTVASVTLLAQAPSTGVSFDVVSIKPNTGRPFFGSNVTQRPDGGITMLNIPLGTLISRAYPPAAPIDMVGLPDWVMRERYDVSATSTLTRPSQDQQTAMLRTMLADRCKLVAHMESREQPVYDLVIARSDGKLGPNLQPSEVDCEAKAAADRAAAEAARAAGTIPPRPAIPDFNGPPPPCSLRFLTNTTEGGATMEALARFLRPAAGRPVIDKTGLKGSYRITIPFNLLLARGPQTAGDSAPSILTALQEELGLKLESSRAVREVLVIDHIERPTEN